MALFRKKIFERTDHMSFSSELQKPRLLELDFSRESMGSVADIHDASVVYTQLAHYDVIDRCGDLQYRKLPFEYSNLKNCKC